MLCLVPTLVSDWDSLDCCTEKDAEVRLKFGRKEDLSGAVLLSCAHTCLIFSPVVSMVRPRDMHSLRSMSFPKYPSCSHLLLTVALLWLGKRNSYLLPSLSLTWCISPAYKNPTLVDRSPRIQKRGSERCIHRGACRDKCGKAQTSSVCLSTYLLPTCESKFRNEKVAMGMHLNMFCFLIFKNSDLTFFR